MTLQEKIKYCEKMLETQKYIGNKVNVNEDILLMCYFISKNIPYQEAYDMWLPIFESRYGETVKDHEPDWYFQKKWNQALKTYWGDDKIIATIYKDEIDIINNNTLPRWTKELALMILVYSKVRKNFVYDCLPYKRLIGYTSLTRRAESKVEESKRLLISANIISEQKIEEFDCHTGEIDENIITRLNIPKSNKNEKIFSVSSLSEVPIYFNYIKTVKKCVICGEEFEYNTKTKRDICIKCWKHNEVIKATNRRKQRCSGEYCE